uniref:Uncharacterized protein n=1 Tax=Cucumis melo TaxID=3656 RepID=A0A9I9E9P0_CUCME
MKFIFAATEEAIFVHMLTMQVKLIINGCFPTHYRALSNAEIERILKNSAHIIPVLDFQLELHMSAIDMPHGIRGRFTGCCASDVVKWIYFRVSCLNEDFRQKKEELPSDKHQAIRRTSIGDEQKDARRSTSLKDKVESFFFFFLIILFETSANFYIEEDLNPVFQPDIFHI